MSIPPCFRKIFLPVILLSGVLPICFAGAADGDVSRSDWLESRKAIHGSLLRTSAYDVLIVPFEVSGNAVDRPGRSLMTRYLDDRLRRTTDLRIPGVTVVSRALGETARTFDEKDVHRLADDLKVKYLVRGYVGHDLEEKMDISITVQERKADGTLTPKGEALRAGWTGIGFSDEVPPEEVFRLLLDDVVARLRLPVTKKPATLFVDGAKTTIPPSLAALVSSKPADPLESALRLQFLGLLAPGWTGAGGPYFERSLVALAQVSRDSPGYALLKSRALYHLHRRPAAVAALVNPSTAEEKAFSAFLDGDLPETAKRTEEILPPLPRLLAQIELNDLRWDYDRHLPRQDTYQDLAAGIPEWTTVLMIRLHDRNYWEAPSNLHVKERLDKEYPIPGPTAESLATSRVMVGDSPAEGEEIFLSVHRHVRKVLDDRGKEFAADDDSASPMERDALDLYAALGESNLCKLVYLRAEIQYLPEAALKDLDLLDVVYKGHPALTYLRALGLKYLAKQRQEDSRASLLRTARMLAANAFAWAGGQEAIAARCVEILDVKDNKYETPFHLYDHDYPRRCIWKPSLSADRHLLRKGTLSTKNAAAVSAGIHPDLRNTELGLLYSNVHFASFSYYYERLVRDKNIADADTVLAGNVRRFAGHPGRTKFLAGIRRKKGDDAGAAQIYEEAIREVPEVWEAYSEYGNMLIEQGAIDNAARLYRKYPLFLSNKNVSRDVVALSNYAFDAGTDFWMLGETEKAVPYYRISADLKTGSGAGMVSSARIFISEWDFQRAALGFLEPVRRYGRAPSIRDYVSLLHALGYGKEAWSVFDTMIGKVSEPAIWSAAFVGHRIDGKSDEEIAQWFSSENIRGAAGKGIGDLLLPIFLIDREPDPASVAMTRHAEQKSASSTVGASVKGSPSDLLAFYGHVQKGDWSDAIRFLHDKAGYFQGRAATQWAALPYMTWARIKVGGGLGTLPGFLDARAQLEPFGYRLSVALLKGTQGQHEEAERILKEAYWRIPDSYKKDRLIDPWYQLVETCEWLHIDSKRPEYRDLAVDLARKHQRIRPWIGWAYSVEAKYADNPADRLRVLGMALYLDRRSARIAGIPEEEKKKAREWLEKNNPFKNRKPAPGEV